MSVRTGRVPPLFPVKLVTAVAIFVASVFAALLAWDLCKPGTARNTTRSIKPAIASTINTSIIVKPLLFFNKFFFVM